MSSITVYRGTPSGRAQKRTVAWPGPPNAHQVTVRVTHSGLCGTDEQYKSQDMILDHEGVGIVEAIGDSVTTLKVGDRPSIPLYAVRESSGITDQVGVLGLGGLSHLAVQYAAKMGCHVTVYSHSSGKAEAAQSLGASDFQVVGSDPLPGRAVDCLLLAGAQQPDWSTVLSLVRRGGVISAMTVDSSELRCQYGEILMNAIRIQGSLPAAPNVQREMLSFSALHKIKPIVETFSFNEDGIDEAMTKLREA
ncbi:hypothetical protein CDV36_006466 [Fusarium kuroshium]|uniref:Alcohol dehydrogenase-like N-terminal domain-containing protein n=1 Tax=Fusarium kuroshium TaxID=2010991 RepID=A0A3M2S8G9_9HYPO|nr:hypothetical protein CDV36_006466 [Fusarium kuroshium]